MNNDLEIIEYVVNQINSSQIISDPFPHKFVEKVFPDSFYKELIGNIPNKDCYTQINKTGSVSSDYSDERYVFDLLQQNDFNKLKEEQKNFYKILIKVMLSKDLFKNITLSFKETIDEQIAKFSQNEKERLGWPNFKFYLRTSLIKDYSKYSLGVHTDNLSKLVTFLFYIPFNNNLSNVGTSLYSAKNETSGDKHYTSEDTKNIFEKIKTCPFIPNSVLIFPRTSKSFHGVEEINISQKERDLLLLNYYYHLNK